MHPRGRHLSAKPRLRRLSWLPYEHVVESVRSLHHHYIICFPQPG
ncbi:hypothetical protein E2C01_069916 [Portunus trituberculatus]|uniref:Uncharacterized protein n=1 Tax=Portunus trituberculatus TaxID=210409 RepID=A0A5B7I0P5_PORTR|nr:hypothetical protein [Portunus trituberculatus]